MNAFTMNVKPLALSNNNHDEDGRFASAPGGGASTAPKILHAAQKRTLTERDGRLFVNGPKGETPITINELVSSPSPINATATDARTKQVVSALRAQGEDTDRWSWWNGKVFPTEIANKAREWHQEREGTSPANMAKQVPGLDEVRTAHAAHENNVEEHHASVRRSYENENGGRIVPLKPELEEKVKALRTAYPRAAVFHDATRLSESTHWSDPVGKVSAAKEAQKILLKGGSVAEATTAMNKRRESDSWR
jgi:hypothetical protein